MYIYYETVVKSWAKLSVELQQVIVKTLELALYHNLGVLPQPIVTHEFF